MAKKKKRARNRRGNKPIFHRTKIESDSPGVVDFIKWSSILKPVQEIVSRQLASCVVDQPILNPMCVYFAPI